MPEENQNKPEDNTTGNSKGEQSTGANNPSDPASSPPQPVRKFAEPKVLEEVIEAVVDPKEKPKEGPVPFSFSTPQQVHQKQAQPTKGDLEQPKEPVKKTLAELDAEIARDEKNGKEHTYDDYKETAEMFIEGWEALFTFAARMISKDTSDSAYEFGKDKKERLIHQATKVSRKRNWVMPIEYLFLGTLLPATGIILLKAQDKRKEYFQKIENQPVDTKVEINKGGPNKGFPKRRGPGRPSK